MPATPSPPTPHDEGLPVSAPIALTDLLALRVPIEWAEAVAVVEELCSALGDVSASAVGIPDLSGIAITARGGVILHRGVDPLQDLDGLGRTLHALLDPGDTPVALRLFVAQSSGSDKYSSVGAYAAALAYYGRPDRTDIIRALYQRCLTTHAPVAMAPVPPPAIVERRPSPPAVRRRVPRWVAIAVTALLCGGGATLAFWFWRQEARASAPVAAIRKVVDAAVAAVQNLASSPSPAAVEPESPAKVIDRPSRQRAAVPVPPVADVIVNATPLLTLPFVDQPAPGPLFERGAISPSASVGSTGSLDPTVYSNVAEDVQPPVMFSPKLPPVPATQAPYSGTNTMELLIDEAGLVQHARMVTGPLRMPDMMLLSNAKTWRFHPAVKDGKPVKYRLSLSWVVAPP